MIASAGFVIERLALSPHPEGGWYRETWRGAPSSVGERRGSGTAILFLLEAGQTSRWHRIDATELWLHQGGGSLILRRWKEGPTIQTRLGPDLLGGDEPQAIVAANVWQTAQAGDAWALVACVVVPAFEFNAFELAPLGWEPETPIRSL